MKTFLKLLKVGKIWLFLILIGDNWIKKIELTIYQIDKYDLLKVPLIEDFLLLKSMKNVSI